MGCPTVGRNTTSMAGEGAGDFGRLRSVAWPTNVDFPTGPLSPGLAGGETSLACGGLRALAQIMTGLDVRRVFNVRGLRRADLVRKTCPHQPVAGTGPGWRLDARRGRQDPPAFQRLAFGRRGQSGEGGSDPGPVHRRGAPFGPAFSVKLPETDRHCRCWSRLTTGLYCPEALLQLFGRPRPVRNSSDSMLRWPGSASNPWELLTGSGARRTGVPRRKPLGGSSRGGGCPAPYGIPAAGQGGRPCGAAVDNVVVVGWAVIDLVSAVWCPSALRSGAGTQF